MTYSANECSPEFNSNRQSDNGLLSDWMSFVRSHVRAYRYEMELKRDVARQRAALADLTDAQLEDIGITRAQAEAEAARSFDDIPVRQRHRR